MLQWWKERDHEIDERFTPPLEHTIAETLGSTARPFLWCIPRRLPRGAVEIDTRLEIICSALIPWLVFSIAPVNPQKPDQDFLWIEEFSSKVGQPTFVL